MKFYSKMLSAGAAVLFIAGCGGDETTGEDEEVTLTMQGASIESFIELAERYEEENPNVTIHTEELNMDDHHNNLFTALSAGEGAPDIATVENSEMDGFQEAGPAFANLYELGAEEVEDDYLDWVWEIAENEEGDYLFGIPTDIAPMAMFYRTDVFEEAGLPTDPEEVAEEIDTWDDYLDAAETLQDEADTTIVDYPYLVTNALKGQMPEMYFDEETEDLILEEEPYMREVYDFTVEMIDEGYIDSVDPETPEGAQAQRDGNSGTLLAPAWQQGVIQDNAPDATEWRVAPLPGDESANWGGSYLTIPAESEHQEEAYEFITWALSPENQLEAFNIAGGLPSTPETYEMDDFESYESDYFGGQNTAEIFADEAEDIEYTYMGRGYPTAEEELENTMANILDGADPDQEWDAMVERLETQLSR